MNSVSGPIAGRLKRPGWTDPRLLIGLALIALSIWGTTSLVSRADRTEPFLVAKGTLTPGTVLSESNVLVSNVRIGDGYVSADDAPWGSIVTRTISPGELIPASAVSESGAFESRPVAVESSLPLADGIVPGAIVDVWLTREGFMGTESILVASGLVIEQVDRGSGSFSQGAETAYVLVPAADVGDFLASLAEDGEIVVVGLAGRVAS
ncbi:MAG: SAF domain-containing protein [Demequinaceae bacterium]|nr:SAF domain-containing protein [Demequinaceae bacterium]